MKRLFKQKTSNFFLILSFLSANYIETSSKCRLRGMSGAHTEEICSFQSLFKVEFLNEAKKVTLHQNQNRILFHGVPGNGKTMYAQVLAKMMNRKLIRLNAAEIVNAYSGRGVEKITDLIETAKKEALDTGNRALIFIDEIESLTSFLEDSHRTEYRLTATQLWTLLDKYNTDFDLVFVFATNNIKNMSPTFLSRFMPTYIIKIENPSKDEMKQLIRSFFLTDFPTLDLVTFHSIMNNLLAIRANEVLILIQHLVEHCKKSKLIEQETKDLAKLNQLALKFKNLENNILNVQKMSMVVEKRAKIEEIENQLLKLVEDSTNETKLSFDLDFHSKNKAPIQELVNIFTLNLKIIFELDLRIDDCATSDKVQEFKVYFELQKAKILEHQKTIGSIEINNSSTASLAHEFTHLVDDYLKKIEHYIHSHSKIPSNIVLNKIVEMLPVLSNRALINLKLKILALKFTSDRIEDNEQLNDFECSVFKLTELHKNMSKADQEEEKQLLARMELIKAYKQLECGSKPEYECEKRVHEEMKYETVKKQLHDLVKR